MWESISRLPFVDGRVRGVGGVDDCWCCWDASWRRVEVEVGLGKGEACVDAVRDRRMDSVGAVEICMVLLVVSVGS